MTAARARWSVRRPCSPPPPCVLGVAPWLADGLIGAARTRSIRARADVHLALWHGFTTALWLSALALGAGVVLFALTVASARPGLGDRLPTADATFLSILRGLNRLADRVTAVVQNGSLPIYAGVILTTVAVLAGRCHRRRRLAGLARHRRSPGRCPWPSPSW